MYEGACPLVHAEKGGSAPVVLRKAQNSVHKFMVVFPEGRGSVSADPSRKVSPFVVRFGLKGFSDYTIHKDKERMKRYVARHAGSASGLRSRRENWSRSGAKAAGFWSRWLLWSKPSFSAALKHTEKVLGRKIVYVK
jgi:hypothetical protein